MHPRWAGVDLHQLQAAVAELAGRPVRRIHAWTNVLFDDGDRVWRCGTDPDAARRNVAVARWCVTQRIPTLPGPASDACDVTSLAVAGRAWTVTCWPRVTVDPVEAGTLDWVAFGQLLATIHATAPPDGLTARYDPLQWTRRRIAAAADTGAARRFAAEADALQARLDELAAGEPAVFLHGDVHLDNLGLVDGTLVVFDWETAAAGPAVGDLWPSAGWVKRTGTPTPAQHADLLAGYRRALEPPALPRWAPVLDAVASLSRRSWELVHRG